MELVQITTNEAERLAPLVAEFRVKLRALRNIVSAPDVNAGREELREFLDAGYPVFAALDGSEYAGYIVCRIEAPCLWVEQLFVRREYRRRGVASLLFEKAEALAAAMGEDTVFNFVHPNNGAMLGFLRAKGYTVLNMLEVRRPYRGETLTTTVRVDDNIFDY